jgi:hypothetical protein
MWQGIVDQGIADDDLASYRGKASDSGAFQLPTYYALPHERELREEWVFARKIDKLQDSAIGALSTALRYASVLGGPELMAFTNYGVDVADQNMREATGTEWIALGGG